MSLFNRTQQIVVLGGGYAGLSCAFRLARLLKSAHGTPATVTLVNTDPRQELTNELFRVLRNGKGEFFNFLPSCKRLGIRFIEGHVSSIDPLLKTLTIRGETNQSFRYDQLVIASGFKTKMPHINGLEGYLDAKDQDKKLVFPYRNNVQVQQLRLSLKRLGWSADTRFPKDVFVVIVGAGITGLEVAGELAHLRGNNARARLILVDEKTELLESFSPIAKKLLKRDLARLRIETVLGSKAIAINAKQELEIQNGQVIPWDLLILCSGGRPSGKVMEKFGEAATPQGLKVKRTLQIEGFPDHYAIGDIAAAPDTHHSLGNQRLLPQTAHYSTQEGRFVAEHIFDKIIHGVPKASRRFEATDYGFLMSLGPYFGFGRVGPEIESPITKFLSPFVVGPVIDQLKRVAKLKYLSSLRWDSMKPSIPFISPRD